MAKTQMIINYVPGEECRVAVVEDGMLEELHAERAAQASRVGNIYIGRVNNVEASIQAAFIDFGVEDNGFLHISDLHPRYFPGEADDATEQVGHKTPRRERPPIQQCLRKGDEVIVQVLKEGVGTKGPTLTSYLSIPGRFLVMMPQMDKVGVSRKVEDEETRRKMREVLDQLDLPDGFGFILRTAGMDRGKAELKRDLAYLQRLWKDMEKRRKGGGKPRLLYSESDLLVRSLRDVLTADMDEVVIDNEHALMRAERFLKIVAPRTKTKLLHYPGKTPIFHAFGIEGQISLIHAREVPLPSGGRLVIDQTEALVAIDVNSGKSRDARDAEDNAYRTNLEAVDEICRQLRLRDLGGIIVNDLIDMRAASRRKEIENRFRERLKRDRAKSTIASISPFGILEMTRQRMRGSHEQAHFSDCPVCRGRGLVQRPESVASEALRDLAALLDHAKVAKIELVVSPRVAGELLSNKRRLLGRIERTSGKHVDVRVSEDIPPDRVSFYAYDPVGADVDLDKLPRPRKPDNLKAWDFSPAPDAEEAEAWASDPMAERRDSAEAEAHAESELEAAQHAAEPHPIEIDEDTPDSDTGEARPGEGEGTDEDGRRRRRRRRRGRGRGGRGEPGAPDAAGAATTRPDSSSRGDHNETDHAPRDPAEGEPTAGDAPGEAAGEGGRRRRRRRRRGRGGAGTGTGTGGNGQAERPRPTPGPGRPSPASAGLPEPKPISRSEDVTPFTIVETMGDWGEDEATPSNPPQAHNPPGDDHGPQDEHEHEGDIEPAQPRPEGAGASEAKRRRRRRRRGRGGSGGDGTSASGGPATATPPTPPPPASRPAPSPRPSASPAPAAREPKPAAGPRSKTPAASLPPVPVIKPPPKALYAARRKLGPGELKKRPQSE